MTDRQLLDTNMISVQRMHKFPRLETRRLCTPFGLFDGLSDCERVDILSCAGKRSFVRDELLFAQGEPVESLILLRWGIAKHTQVSSNGSEVIVRISCGGDLLDLQGSSARTVHTCTVRALEKCQALVWDCRRIQRLVLRYPRLRTNLDRILIAHIEALERNVCEMATEKVPRRLALVLVRLHKQIGKNGNHPVVLTFTREELAQMAGATVFTISRLIARWVELGLVTAGREEIVVRDERRLESLHEG